MDLHHSARAKDGPLVLPRLIIPRKSNIGGWIAAVMSGDILVEH